MTTNLKAHVLDPDAMDASARPQDDFFRHINGAWLDTAEIPADRAAHGAFHALHDRSEEDCHAIVKDAVAGKINDADAHRIAILFSQFMDEETVEAQGGAPLLPFLEPISAATTHDELAGVNGRLARMGISSFFSEAISTDLNDSSRYIMYFDQAGLGLPDESYYRDDKYAEIREKYIEYIVTMFTLAQVTPADEVRDAAQKVFDFETRLASHHWDVVRDREVEQQNNPRSWDEVREQNPGFAWGLWAEGLELDPANITSTNVNQLDFLEAAAKLWEQTDLETLKLWLARKVVSSYAPYLSSLFVLENFDFYSRTLTGAEELRPRWKRGLGLVEGVVGESLGRLFVARHFPAEYKERMEDLVAHLIEAYRASIADLDWMGEETKAKALEKLDTFTPKIAYPNKWRDYSALDISADNTLLQNIAAAQTFDTDYELSRLGKPVDRDEWFMTPQTVNAYYNPLMNEIVFPAGILRPPFFNPEADDAVNYGAIGAVIGHEIGHGFDDQGSQFDAEGELKNWWTDEDRQEFERRTKTLISQYDAYTPSALDDSHHVNGALTIGENIGDLGGLTIAWKALQSALDEAGYSGIGDSPVIDGLTAAERFFTSWATVWRGKRRAEYAIQLLAIDPHSPEEFRCNGTLSNFDAFIDFYGVQEGDSMWISPENRVRIW